MAGHGSAKFSWYEPLRDREALRRAVFYVMSRPGLFLNTSSDTTILRDILEAASEAAVLPARAEMSRRRALLRWSRCSFQGCPTESSLGSDR